MTDIRISWSALRSHTECHQKSFLQRTGKKASLEDQRNFFPGTVTDRVVRDWLADFNPEADKHIMPAMVEDYVKAEQEKIEKAGKQLKWRNLQDRDNVIKECQKAVDLIEPYLDRYVIPYEYDVDFSFKAPISAMHPVTGEPSVITLNGFMDIIVKRGENDWAVYDVKHTKDNNYWRKTRGQLSFYDLAVNIMFGAYTSEVALLQPLCDERFKDFDLGEQERTILLKHVLDMANDIWLNNHEPNAPASACFNCNVKHACTRFKPVQSGNKKKISLVNRETP